MKSVLITGANSGLGEALTAIFSKHGWETIAASHEEMDIADQQSIHAYISKLNEKPIDVLINCAGVYDSSDIDDEKVVSSIAEITKVFQVNTIGARVLTEALLLNLKKGDEKLVVTISSGMGTYKELDEYHAKHWPYCASKTALNYVMVAFNKLYPEIKCALINPGWMKTKLGGPEAPLEPSYSAEKIFGLIQNHKKRLPNGKLVDYEGKLMEF